MWQHINHHLWLQHAWINRIQSFILLFFLGGFLALLGWLVWGGSGVVLLLLMGGISILFNPALSPHWLMRWYGARRIHLQQAPVIHHILAQLARRAGLPAIPALYYIPSRVLNAFAVGQRDNAAIAVSDGLLRQLNQRELSSVLAHEVSHIQHNDLWVMGLADMFSRATSLLSLFGQLLLIISLPAILFTDISVNWLVVILLILAPTVSALAQLALSRTREYDADLNAVYLTGDADGLAAALLKIEQVQGNWIEKIFMPGRRIPQPSLLRTHPHIHERVQRLLALKKQQTDIRILPLQLGDLDVRHVFGEPVRRRPRWRINGLWH